jgi:hypothetical protein
MASEEFIASVEQEAAHDLSINAGMKICRIMTGELKRNGLVEEVVCKAIYTAFDFARRQIAARNIGKMTFAEAMQAVTKGKLVTRPGWHILRVVVNFERRDEGEVFDWELDNFDGFPSGGGSPYEPTEDDRAATDWMEYQVPEEIDPTSRMNLFE